MFVDEIKKISNVSAETKNAMTRKSAQTLPTNPSAQGYSADEIKRRFYQPILDTANSTLAEIDRVANEANEAISQVDNNLNTFMSQSLIKEPYKIKLNESSWVYNQTNSRYEVSVASSLHGITNVEEIGVDMFLLDGHGKYISVNQFEILQDGTVRCFHENNSAGFVSIYIKREGYVFGDITITVDQVKDIAKVAKSNKYDDLDNLPNLDTMYENEEMLSKIIAGTQKVNSAINATNAENATYASTCGTADNATNAENASRAITDQHGVNIASGYCKQNGTYPNLKSGSASVADEAISDEDGNSIKLNYAKNNGSYPLMIVGKATQADSATNASEAMKATQDSDGNNIKDTYATKTGTYSSLTVGNATTAENATKASYIKLETSAPSSSPPEGCISIYFCNSLPSTRYDRVLYLVTY